MVDLRAYDRAKARLASGEDEMVPGEFVHRLVAGESPVRLLRDWRGLTRAQLAALAQVNGCRSPTSRRAARPARWKL